MKGALIFLVAFVVFVFISLGLQEDGSSELPPGRWIYGLLEVEETDRPVMGIGATDLVVAVFNGVVYGVIVWFVFDLIDKLGKSGNKGERREPERPPEQSP